MSVFVDPIDPWSSRSLTSRSAVSIFTGLKSSENLAADVSTKPLPVLSTNALTE